MEGALRFLADMGISPRIAERLRILGYDAVHLREQGLQRLPDPDIWAKARDELRVVLTADLDFGYLAASSHGNLPSVILFRLADMRPDRVFSSLERVIGLYSEELMTGAVVVVREVDIRVRRLPIGQDIE